MVDLGDDEGVFDRLSGMFWDRFFPVVIIKRPDYLIIEDRRIAGNMLVPAIGIFAIVIALGIFLSPMLSSTWLFLLFALLATAAILFAFQVLAYFFRQTILFYKDKDTYEIINRGIFGTIRDTGAISDIKEIRILLTHYTSDGERHQVSSSRLIPKNLILNDLRIQDLERKTLNNSYSTTTRIVYAISGFLDIRTSQEEVDSF
jgi:hypothetical protein